MVNKGPAKPIAQLFPSRDNAKATGFVASSNSEKVQRNLYFPPNADFLDSARKKENLSAVRFLHVDLDYKDYTGDEKEQIDHVFGILLDEKKRPKGIPLPTAIWMTGGGCQAVWKLDEPLEVQKAEDINKALLLAFQGGPGTHNADRLLRLPWTMNWLNDKKRESGR